MLTSIVLSSLKKVTEGGGIPNAVHLRMVVTFELMVNSVGMSHGPSGNSVISGKAAQSEERGGGGGQGKERWGKGCMESSKVK